LALTFTYLLGTVWLASYIKQLSFYLQVLLASTTAACKGISLVAATHIIHLDVTSSHTTVDQATKRVHRFGQEEAVEVHHLMAAMSIDEALIQHVHPSRRELASKIVDGFEAAEEKGGLEDAMGLFSAAVPIHQKLYKAHEEPKSSNKRKRVEEAEEAEEAGEAGEAAH